MQHGANGGPRLNFPVMDGLRGVAALCVMFYHFTQTANVRLFPQGSLAVDIFFCLSGFVIAQSYQARLDDGLSLLGFARVRLVRLYPLYCVGLALGVVNLLATGALGGQAYEIGKFGLVVVNGLFVLPTLARFTIGIGADQTDHVAFPLNGPSWSLFFELLSNALYAVLRPRGLTLVLLVSVLAVLFVETSLLYRGPSGWGSHNILGGFPRALFAFYLGTGLRQLWGTGALRVPGRLAPAALVLTPIVCSAPDSLIGFLAAALIAAPAMVCLATAQPRLSPLARRAFALLGEISYPLYAIHLPAFGLLKLAIDALSGAPLDTPLSLVAATALGVGLVIVCLALSRLYDRPVRRALMALPMAASRQASIRLMNH
ncbi:MAG: acyltransferase [Hyphomicrobiales bacterium]|nr:acyltransferase [Hyphomicrobiales bacterium]